MITITLNKAAKDEYEHDAFLTSLKAQSSSEEVYEVADSPSKNSKIQITIPDNCLVLGKDWDKYINYYLDNGFPKYQDQKTGEWIYTTTWREIVIKRMGLVSRTNNGVFEGLDIKIL